LSVAIRDLNSALEKVAKIIDRPANIGHAGEFIASTIFDVDLNESASAKDHDGRFGANSPLLVRGKTVNVKWYSKDDGLIALKDPPSVDYYLVLAGPKSGAVSSRGTTRPLVISSVYLFDAAALIMDAKERGVGINVATTVRNATWDAAMIYPIAINSLLEVSREQSAMISLFAPVESGVNQSE
jgi:hypothetical protein